MLTVKQKIKYLLSSVFRYMDKVNCTYCGSNNCIEIDRKYFFTRLFECSDCHLYFRHPVEKYSENKKFYQEEYTEKDKITAALPSDIELEHFKNDGFNRGNKNAERYIKLFACLYPEINKVKIIDYGCSWGYISWQIKQAGLDIESFEISVPRAKYGIEKLNLNIHTEEKLLRNENDIFFSSHVIEHHPDIHSMIQLAKQNLKSDGFFIAFSPNGSKDYRNTYPDNFHHFWGKVHPNYLNVDFYKEIFADFPYYIGSSPVYFENITIQNINNQFVDDLHGDELIVIAKIKECKTY